MKLLYYYNIKVDKRPTDVVLSMKARDLMNSLARKSIDSGRARHPNRSTVCLKIYPEIVWIHRLSHYYDVDLDRRQSCTARLTNISTDCPVSTVFSERILRFSSRVKLRCWRSSRSMAKWQKKITDDTDHWSGLDWSGVRNVNVRGSQRDAGTWGMEESGSILCKRGKTHKEDFYFHRWFLFLSSPKSRYFQLFNLSIWDTD